jgi:hypothetical protein
MPAGKGKVRLRCCMKAELYEELLRESKQQKVDLGSVIEGYVEQARLTSHGTEHILARRMETLLHGQEQLFHVVEALVAAMEGRQVSATPVVEGEDEPPPIASYAQMYGAEKTAPYTPEAPVVTEETTKRSWRPW